MIKKIYTKSHDIELLKSIDKQGKIFTAQEHAYITEAEYSDKFQSYEILLKWYLSENHRKLEALSFLIEYLKQNDFSNLISFGAGQCVLEHLLGFVYPSPHFRIVATDFDAYFIEKARKYFHNIESIQFDLFNDSLIEFSENLDIKFDIGISFESFYIMNNEQYIYLLKQCKECKIKTIIYFSVSMLNFKSVIKQSLSYDRLREIPFLHRLLRKESLDYRGKLHGYARNQRELKKLYLAAGYELKRKLSLPRSYKDIFVFNLIT